MRTPLSPPVGKENHDHNVDVMLDARSVSVEEESDSEVEDFPVEYEVGPIIVSASKHQQAVLQL
jgi:hypothetical protein